MAKYALNEAAVTRARELIDARQYVLDGDWGEAQPRAEDQNSFLERHGWDEPDRRGRQRRSWVRQRGRSGACRSDESGR